MRYRLYCETERELLEADIEDRLRRKEAAQAFDDEFIQLARSVYQINDERAAIKREINRILSSGLVEEKSYPDYSPPSS